MNKDNAINNAKSKINSISRYVAHYIPSLEQQTILSNQILKKLPTELHHVEGSVFMIEVKTQIFCTFHLGTQEGILKPMGIIVGFQQQDRQDSQTLNNDTFYRPPVTSAQGIIVTEKIPDSAFFKSLTMMIIYKDMVELEKLLEL